jgi:hypothetical protein
MRRNREFLEKRNRRFLLPLLELTCPAVTLLIGGRVVISAICSSFAKLAPSSSCSPFPSSITYILLGVAILGACVSAWRFYKDYICHERFDGIW